MGLVAIEALVAFGQPAQVIRYSTGKQNVAGQTVWNYCGQNIRLNEGFAQFNFNATLVEGRWSILGHFQLHAQGTGVVDGALFVANLMDNYSFGGGARGFTYNSVGEYHLIEKGPKGEDMFLVFEYHATVKADGTVDAVFDRFSIECR